MKRIYTCYDNLKVTRHAPPEVIRAAYKILSQKAFKVEKIRTTSGTQFSNLTITLYKVLNGNMRTYDLSENEFSSFFSIYSGHTIKLSVKLIWTVNSLQSEIYFRGNYWGIYLMIDR